MFSARHVVAVGLAITAVSAASLPDDDCFACPSPWETYNVSATATGTSGTSEARACEEAKTNLNELLAGAAGHTCCTCTSTASNCPRNYRFGTLEPVCDDGEYDEFEEEWTVDVSFSGNVQIKCKKCLGASGEPGN